MPALNARTAVPSRQTKLSLSLALHHAVANRLNLCYATAHLPCADVRRGARLCAGEAGVEADRKEVAAVTHPHEGARRAGASSAETVLLRRASSGSTDVPMACAAPAPAYPRPPPAAPPPAVATPPDPRCARPPLPARFVLACMRVLGRRPWAAHRSCHASADGVCSRSALAESAASTLHLLMPGSAWPRPWEYSNCTSGLFNGSPVAAQAAASLGAP